MDNQYNNISHLNKFVIIQYQLSKKAMQQQIYHFSMQELIDIQAKINNKTSFQKVVKSFAYSQQLSMKDNLQELSKKVIEYFKLEGQPAKVFQKYFIERNMPIEVNLQPLKSQQLMSIIQDCISVHSENSTVLQRNHTYTFRNILLKRILLEQKQTIDQYFSTLSAKSMLKGVDLYPLLIEIFSHYSVYEQDADSEMFFDKINSFNVFINVVNKYNKSERRLAFTASNQKDIQYIRRSQFQRLIQFWENQTAQLKVLTEKRINITERGNQTESRQQRQCQVQTEKQDKSLLVFINHILQNLNVMTTTNNNGQQLQSIQRIYEFLRKEKLNMLHNGNGNAVSIHSNVDILSQLAEKTEKTQKKSIFARQNESFEEKLPITPIKYLNLLVNKYDQNETIEMHQTNNINKRQQEKKALAANISKNKNQVVDQSKRLSEFISRIYNHYYEIQGFDINILSRCLVDIGIMQAGNYKIIAYLVKNQLFFDEKHINMDQFNQIFRYLMKNDKDLTLKVIEQFIRKKIDYGIQIKRIQGSPFKTSSPSKYRLYSYINDNYHRNYKGKYLNKTEY